MHSDKKWCRSGVLGETNQQAACIYTICYSNALLYDFKLVQIKVQTLNRQI